MQTLGRWAAKAGGWRPGRSLWCAEQGTFAGHHGPPVLPLLQEVATLLRTPGASAEALRNEGAIANSREALSFIHTGTSGGAQGPFHKTCHKLPKSFLRVGDGTRNQAQSKISTFRTAGRSQGARLVTVYFPRAPPRHGLLHSSLPDSHRFSHKNVFTFVGIEKMLKRSKYGNREKTGCARRKRFCP